MDPYEHHMKREQARQLNGSIERASSRPDVAFDFDVFGNVIDRAVHKSPPPLDDVGGCDPEDFDEKDPWKVEPLGQRGYRAHEICEQAAKIVRGDRAAKHGPKERNHQNIADHWNAYLGARLTKPLTALDVALMMAELKIARTKAGQGRYNLDNYVDIAGYAGAAGEIALLGGESADGE